METRQRPSKLPLLLGGLLLAIGVISAVISATSVSSFDKPTDVQADKTYYLLGDKSSINSKQCVLKGENDQPVNGNTVKAFENKISDDGKIKDISLPLTSSKGVVASMEFASEQKGLHYTCDEGKTYLSTKSSGTLNLLRWLTMAGILGGLVLLLSSLIPRKGADHTTHQDHDRDDHDDVFARHDEEHTPLHSGDHKPHIHDRDDKSL